MANLESAHHPLSAILPNTEYFEIDSDFVGARFGVWVTTPAKYGDSDRGRFPVIFALDGNLRAPLSVPSNAMLTDDPIHPIVPFIQVSVGYCGPDVQDALRIRNRDLLPPGEPPAPSFLAGLDRYVASGRMTIEQKERYHDSVLDGHADKFLGFLADELYPCIVSGWRCDPTMTGLFGTSYSGLFAAWVAMQCHPKFLRIGAGSPGMMTLESKVFELLQQQLTANVDHSGRFLHFTVADLEITSPSFYQLLGRGFAQFCAILGATPLKGLTFSSHVIPYESHFTVGPSSWFSFLRACYSAKNTVAMTN